MNDVLQYLADNIVTVCSVVVGLLCFIVTWVRTGSVKKAILKLKECEDEMLKYRVAEKVKPTAGQEFSNTVPDYILDPVTNELERSKIDKDIQAYIDSYVDVALDRALDKFLPNVQVESDVVQDYTVTSQDLARMGEAFEVAEHYRDLYNLDPEMSVADVYKFVGQQADKMKNDLLNYSKPKETEQNVETKETK